MAQVPQDAKSTFLTLILVADDRRILLPYPHPSALSRTRKDERGKEDATGGRVLGIGDWRQRR